MNKEAFIYGIQPNSSFLEEAHRGVEKGRVSPYDYMFAQQRERASLIKLQRENNFSFIEDGKYNWDDIFRPFISASKGIEPGELKRWFNTNSFYRIPIISGNVKLDTNEFASYLPYVGDDKQKITLPSPFTFAKLSSDKDASFHQTLEKTTQLVAEAVEFACSKSSVVAIQLNEPFAAHFGFENNEEKLFEESLREVAKRVKHSKLFVHFYFGDGAPLLKSFEEKDIPVDAFGVDFENTNFLELPTNTSRDLIAGVLDAENSPIEQLPQLQELISGIERHSNPKTLYLTHNADAEFLSKQVFEKKIKVLGELLLL